MGFMQLAIGLAEGIAPDEFCCPTGWQWGLVDTAMVAGWVVGMVFYCLVVKVPDRSVLERRP